MNGNTILKNIYSGELYPLRFSIYNRRGPGNRRTRDHSVQKKVQTDLFNRLVPKQRVPIDQVFTLGFLFLIVISGTKFAASIARLSSRETHL